MKCLVKVMSYLSRDIKTGVLFHMRGIGQKWRNVLSEYKPMFEEMTQDFVLRESASACIDIIEGRR